MEETLSRNIRNRNKMIKDLREELVGPSPQGEMIDCSGEIQISDYKQAYQPWRQKDTGEEILTIENPMVRYGVGVLYPIATNVKPEETDNTAMSLVSNSDVDLSDSISNNPTQEIVKDIINTQLDSSEEENINSQDSDNLDLSIVNAYKPSAMAVSFLAEIPQGSRMKVNVSGGRYYPKTVFIGEKERIWWLRSPVLLNGEFDDETLLKAGGKNVSAVRMTKDNCEGLDIDVEVISRATEENERLVTIYLINRSKPEPSINEASLFQSHFTVTIDSENRKSHILPYPKSSPSDLDTEEQSLDLIYRKSETFAVGHGCAADWDIRSHEDGKAYSVSAECLPVCEVPSITADIKRNDGSLIDVSMAELSNLIPGEDGFAALQELVNCYEEWIKEKQFEIDSLESHHRPVAKEHVNRCIECAERMKAGINFLRNNPKALKAFQLANQAILLQQICSQSPSREIEYSVETAKIRFTKDYSEPDLSHPPKGRGRWRAFQIAFLLMSIESAANSDSSFREVVDLIWFPTGGGKTEAYLGLAAFVIFYRRLLDPKNIGVNVLMRYTLRLLTSQQFQRASSLICAMEYIRRQDQNALGTNEFSIGMWLGGDVTPNTHEKALDCLRELRKDTKYAENKFVLVNCPWCNAQIGPVKYKGKIPKSIHPPRLLGYAQEQSRVVLQCSDKNCPFSDRLPIYVVDEDIYEKTPTVIIGTVDKFALLPWEPRARAIFGIGEHGHHIVSPPSLIIQDELHLISGPLGSMVGLFESVIEELCTDRRNNIIIKPKIVSSTATIRSYSQQIKALYARDRVTLFPSPGLHIDDSFFARYARNDDGSLMNGKIFVGVHAPSLGSVQTAQVRTFTSLLQSPMELNTDERDPWWTLVCFFNSLRELGNTISLFQSDIPTRLGILRNRFGLQFNEIRPTKNINILELTGRMKNEEIHQAIPLLRTTCSGYRQPVDACLASNIIEVGIDIDRLSLMTIVGQPKTTSQYIQVTGRIGRLWQERPGLIVTIFSPSKPRDRSHFEKFRSYHEKLYAQVEPTSVTPFSVPAMERALHSVMVAYVRQFGDEASIESPYPCPDLMLARAKDIFLKRLEAVDNEAKEDFGDIFNKRVSQWRRWHNTSWRARWDSTNPPLMTRAGSYVNPQWQNLTWRTPNSMRNVDAECEMQITSLYLHDSEDNDG